MQYLGYFFFRLTVFIVSIIPFWLLYRISNIIAFILNHILKYRLKVIRQNLQLTENSISQDKTLIRDIYRNLSDIILESFKGFSMSKSEMKKRHKVTNPEILNALYKNNKSVIVTTGHYNNWEWGAFSPNFYVQHKIVGLYKPLTNPQIDTYMQRKRGKYGTILASIDDTSKYFKQYVNDQSIFLLAADQSPTKPELAIWVPFLGLPTPCPHGLEKYSDKYDLAIIYAHVKRVKRGYYEVEMSWIKKDNEQLKYVEATRRYMEKLDGIIKENPANWLWTHRKWKHIDRFDGIYSHEKKENLFS